MGNYLRLLAKRELQRVVDSMDDCPDNDEAFEAIVRLAVASRKELDGMVKKNYNRAAAADYLNMSLSTFNRRIEDGTIPQGEYDRDHNQICWSKEVLDSIS